MRAAMEISPVGKYAILAAFGAVFGLITSVIFLLVYYGQQFAAPVSDNVRMRSAFGITTAIIFVTLIIYFRKEIIRMIRESAPEDPEELE